MDSIVAWLGAGTGVSGLLLSVYNTWRNRSDKRATKLEEERQRLDAETRRISVKTSRTHGGGGIEAVLYFDPDGGHAAYFATVKVLAPDEALLCTGFRQFQRPGPIKNNMDDLHGKRSLDMPLVSVGDERADGVSAVFYIVALERVTAATVRVAVREAGAKNIVSERTLQLSVL